MPIAALPTEVLSLVLSKLSLVRNIKGAKRTCRAFRDAAPAAEQAHRRLCFEHGNAVGCVAAAPDGRVITSSKVNVSGHVNVWRNGTCERTIEAHQGAVWGVAVLPGGTRFVSGSSDRTAKLWTLDGAPEGPERTFQVGRHVLCVAPLPDGVHFAVGIDNDTVRLYHVDGTLVHTFKGHADWVRGVAVTPDGQHIISGSFDNSVKVWSVASRRLVGTCRGQTKNVFAVAAMPDGQRILSGSAGTVFVHLLDGTLVNTFELHTSTVYALVTLPDNQHALSASWDLTVKLFNVNDGRVLRTFTHHTAYVRCLALLPDGLRFVSGLHDHTARLVELGI